MTTYDRIFLMLTFKRAKRATKKTISDYKWEVLVKQGREQFELLLKKGLGVPVVML